MLLPSELLCSSYCSVSNNSTETQRAKMWVFNLWPVCALSNYLCPSCLYWSQLVEAPEKLLYISVQNLHRLSFPLYLKSDVNKAKQLHLFCPESELLPANLSTVALVVANLYKQTMLCTNSLVFWDLCCHTWACFSGSWCPFYFFLCLLPSTILPDRDEE